MKLILVNSEGRSQTVNLKVHVVAKLALLAGLFCIPLSIGWLIGDHRSQTVPDFLNQMTTSLAKQADMQGQEVHSLKQDTIDKLQALNIQVGKMQARIIRVESVAEQVGQQANIDVAEFNFNNDPAIGGPSVIIEGTVNEGTTGQATSLESTYGTLLTSLNNLNNKVNERLWQVELLEDLLQSRSDKQQSKLSGSPVSSGWLSSKFGYRTDPFSGLQAWHNGVDIAGREGSGVLSIASGIVTFAGVRDGYGNLVEIKHENDLITRYGHNKDIKVKVGDIISKAQVIATMGSTGRSTGPHTHFEVYRNGRAINPSTYVQKHIR